jgi:prepilin-type N-terminal cleavage/methylation domain-containing protein
LRRGFTLIEILIVVAILGLLASIAVGGYVDVRSGANETATLAQLRTIRGQITTHDYNYGSDQFDPTVGGAWTQLMSRGYLQSQPLNPFNGSVSVATAPAAGVGWVWADLGNGHTIYAVNEAGNYFDANGDGTPD